MGTRLEAARLTRRDTLRLLGSAAGAAVVGACGPISTPSSSPAARSAAPQPRSGGSLTAGSGVETNSLDGHRIFGPNQQGIFMAFDTLIAYDEKRQPQPMLAESWDVSSDGRQVKLNLRKGVQFHSGRELTSDDVKFNVLRVRDASVGAAQLLFMSNWFSAIDTPDKSTVILKSDQPRPAAFDFLEYLNIVDQSSVTGPNAKTKAVGTGPFTFVEWLPGDHMRFAKNKSYWQSGRPYLDEVVVSLTKDPQALVTRLEAGALGAAFDAPAVEVARLRREGKFQVFVGETGLISAMAGNTTQGPTTDKRVRQALNFAMDRKRFVDSVLLGFGEPRILPWPPSSPAYESSKVNAYTFDLDKARSLLRDAGITSTEMDFNFAAPSTVYGTEFGQIYQSDLAKIGVKLNLKPQELNVFNDAARNTRFNGVAYASGGFSQIEPASLFLISAFWNPDKNTGSFKSSRYSQLVASASTEPDPAKRKQIYSQLNDLVLDESFVMTTASIPTTIAASTKVHGFRFRLNATILYTDAWVET